MTGSIRSKSKDFPLEAATREGLAAFFAARLGIPAKPERWFREGGPNGIPDKPEHHQSVATPAYFAWAKALA